MPCDFFTEFCFPLLQNASFIYYLTIAVYENQQFSNQQKTSFDLNGVQSGPGLKLLIHKSPISRFQCPSVHMYLEEES